jgi:hypothetical protein
VSRGWQPCRLLKLHCRLKKPVLPGQISRVRHCPRKGLSGVEFSQANCTTDALKWQGFEVIKRMWL